MLCRTYSYRVVCVPRIYPRSYTLCHIIYDVPSNITLLSIFLYADDAYFLIKFTCDWFNTNTLKINFTKAQNTSFSLNSRVSRTSISYLVFHKKVKSQQDVDYWGSKIFTNKKI